MRERERGRETFLFSNALLKVRFARSSLSLSLSPSRSFVFVTSSEYTNFCATHKHAPKRKQNAFFCFFREGGEVIEKKKKNKNNKINNNKR